MTGAKNGTIVTFYSYKGGTGRTMALANIAWILASNGYRVLVVDWDLESPGLHRYFHPFLADKHLANSAGVIDMLREYADAVLQPHTGETDWIAYYADVLRHAVSLEWTFEKQPGSERGGIDLLPAGRQNSAYAKAVATFDWTAFYERLGGNAYLDALARSMRESYDYILIDSRTGVSDGAGVCTVRLPDSVVAAFTMNDQSIDGAVAVTRSILRQRTQPPVRIIPVPMRVEDGEQRKLEAGRDHARRSFAPVLTVPGTGERMRPEEAERYWGEVEIPYKKFYAYEEILATFGDRPQQENTLLAAYERLAGVISLGAADRLVPIDDRTRRRWLLAFERHVASATTDVFVSYTAIDRMWAEWIVGELGRAGLRVEMSEVGIGPEAGADLVENTHRAGRMVVLLSQDYVESDGAVEMWKRAAARDADGPGRFLVPIRLDSTRLPAPFSDRMMVELSGLSEERAIETLHDTFEIAAPQRVSSTPATERHRFPAAEPLIWSVPQRNAGFTGRRALLGRIRDRLSAAETTVAPQVLYGLGGVGKTQTALEYVHRFRADYDVVWWVSAQQPSIIRTTLADLADPLGTNSSESVSARIADVLQALRRGTPHGRWLLVFDNADNPDDVRELLPQGSGHVLLTTRNIQAWTREANVERIEVGVFTRPESTSLLRRRVSRLEPEEAEAVAERLGDLPLALEQAGAWLATTGSPVARYLQRLESRLPSMLEEELPPDYQQTGAAPWIVSMQSLRENSPAAAKLLEICAFFAPEPIPMSLLYDDRFISVLQQHDPSRRDPSLVVDRAIREIGRYALARIDSGRQLSRIERRRRGETDAGRLSIEVHRLVQAVIRASLTAEEAEENRRHVHAVLAAADPKDPDQPERWPEYAELWPHILPSGAIESDQPSVRSLLRNIARYLWKRVDYSACEEFAAEVVGRWRNRFGADDPETLMMEFHLANALRLQARYRESFEIDERVFERLRHTVGERDEYTITVASSFASDMRALGDFTGARDLDQRTFDLAGEVFGRGHNQALIAAHNLAISLRLVGDLRGALITNETNLANRREALGDKHPYTLYSKAQYGRDLRETGALQKSRQILDAAVDEHRQVLGEEHPETLRCMKNLAVTLRKLGEFEDAYKLSTQTLRRTLKVYGRDHPDVQACEMNLACDESALGRDGEAIRLARPVCQWYRANAGEGHIYTLAYSNNLAIFLYKIGELTEAYDLIRDVITRLDASIGDRHPYTLAANINLSNCLYAMGDLDTARTHDEQEYSRITEVLGAHHPDALAAASNLVISRRETNDASSSRELLDRISPTLQLVLGDHPSVRAAAANVRLNCDLEPPPT